MIERMEVRVTLAEDLVRGWVDLYIYRRGGREEVRLLGGQRDGVQKCRNIARELAIELLLDYFLVETGYESDEFKKIQT